MRTLQKIIFKQLFSAFANRLKNFETQYHCEQCHQRFSVLWNLAANPMNPYINRGSLVRCPYCGEVHKQFICFGNTAEFMPYKLALKLQESKNLVTVAVDYEAFCFNDRYITDVEKGKEVFCFNVAKRTATFIRTVEGTHESLTIDISSPFDTTLLKTSILRFLTSYSLIRVTHKDQITGLFRQLRTIIETKTEQLYGYKQVEKMYYPNTGALSGMFLLPLKNIAYRMVFSDVAGNSLPAAYEMIPRQNPTNAALLNKISPEIMKAFHSLRAAGESSISALLTAAGLANLPFAQKILRADLYSMGKLMTAFSLCKNNDLAFRYFAAFQGEADEQVETYLRFIGTVYGEAAIVRLAENSKGAKLADCSLLFSKLNTGNIAKINAKEIRLRDLHDWMALTHQKQTHQIFNFDVPEHIVSRLAMQTERLKFYLPKDSMELLEAGNSLHNCVASYGEAVRDHKKMIVLVTTDNGSLTGCIEIKENRIIQAKCDGNKAVSTKAELNRSVLDWAEKVGLDIDTKDIYRPTNEIPLQKTA